MLNAHRTFGPTLALTLGERESEGAVLYHLSVTVVFAALRSFANETTRPPFAFERLATGERFSLSWGRGTG